MITTDPRYDMRHAEAIDPSTPPERLAELMVAYLDEVLTNPALPRLIAERPDFWALLPWGAAQQLVRHPKCPLAFAEWEVRNNHWLGCRSEFVPNRALPAALRREAFKNSGPDSRWSRELLLDLLTPDELAVIERAQAFAERTSTEALTESEVERLSTLGYGCQQLVRTQPNASPELLDRLWETHGLGFHTAVMFHPRISRRRLAAVLAEGKDGEQDPRIWWCATQNSTLSPMEREFAAAAPAARPAVVQRWSLSREWIECLLHHANHALRTALAANESLTAGDQLILASDPSSEVRAALRENPTLTAAARQRMAEREAQGR